MISSPTTAERIIISPHPAIDNYNIIIISPKTGVGVYICSVVVDKLMLALDILLWKRRGA